MGRYLHNVPILPLVAALWACAGCGGSSSYTQPPPPVPDFSLALSSTFVPVQQGGTSPAINVSVAPSNGFTGNVQVTLNALPAGVISNPLSPFTIAAGASTPVVFGAAANASTGNFTVSVVGTSGSLSHTQSLALTVQAGTAATIPRTAYARTDSVSAADAPVGEPHHRHIAYGSANKQRG